MSEIPEVFAIFEQKLAHVLSFTIIAQPNNTKQAIKELLAYFSGIVERASKAESRIAELEAENDELKERVAMLDVTAVFKSLGEMGHIEQVANVKTELDRLNARIAELESTIERLIEAGKRLLDSLCIDPEEEKTVEVMNWKAVVDKVNKEREIACKHCHGTGTVYLEGSIHGEDICPKCHGTGIKERAK